MSELLDSTGMVTVIRCSSLNDYSDCNRRGASRLFGREVRAAGYKLRWTRRAVGGVVGTSVHKAASVALAEKATSGSLPPFSVALDAGQDELKHQFQRGEIDFDGPKGATHSLRDAERQVASMTQSYHHTIAPLVEPILVEQRLTAEVEPGLVLTGQPDMVCREPGMIRDLKTGVMPPSSYAPQLGGYSLLSRSHGYSIESAEIDFLQRVRPDRPQPDPVPKRAVVANAETAASNILRQMARDLDVFRHGDAERRIMPGDAWAFSANPSSKLCSPKYCSAFGTDFCHEGDPSKEVK